MNGIESKPPAGGSISARSVSQPRVAPERTNAPRKGGTVVVDGADAARREYPAAGKAARAGEIPDTAQEAESGPSLGEETLEKAFEQMESLEKEIDGLDPEKPGDQKKLMQIQLKLQRIQQVVSLINEIRKARHNMAMAVINNIN